MPVVKSSVNGDDVTVIIFSREEIDALVLLLENSNLQRTEENKTAIRTLDEFYFALGLKYPPDLS